MVLRKFFTFLFIIFLAVISLYMYARFIEPGLLKVHYENISSSLITEDKKELRILQFSDMHISENFNEADIKKAVEKINEEIPDIVVFTGDLIDEYNKYENKENINEIWEILSGIKASLGKYAIYGNHDYGGGAERIYKKIMKNSGFELLKNEKVSLGEYNINIIGMDDSIFGKFDKKKLIKLLDDDSYNIVLGHEPDVVDPLLQYNIDLFLSGHSHGGQVNLPGIKLFFPSMAQKYTGGIYSFNNYRQTVLYVNAGLGTSHIPLRFMAPPELSVFILKGR